MLKMKDFIKCGFDEEEQSFLHQLLQTVSPSGNEGECRNVVASYLKKYCNLEIDSLGNLYATAFKRLSNTEIMITSHMDEIGFQITKISDNGLAFVRRLGGVDRQTIPGSMITIADKSRDIVGVFGKISPHIQRENEKNQIIEQENLWVDFGFTSKDDAQRLITVGDYVGLSPNYKYSINNKCIFSKGLDNKISVFILAILLKRLAILNSMPKNLTAVFTVQEEIGCRGAMVATRLLNPKVAICLDVAIASDIPGMTSKTFMSDLYLDQGPALCIAPDNTTELVNSLKELAIENKIPYQITTGLSPANGTEASIVQTCNSGVATANIGIPSRYMHSAVEMCSLIDAHYTINLLTEYLNTHFLRVM